MGEDIVENNNYNTNFDMADGMRVGAIYFGRLG
jgi:hypothetical protein